MPPKKWSVSLRGSKQRDGLSFEIVRLMVLRECHACRSKLKWHKYLPHCYQFGTSSSTSWRWLRLARGNRWTVADRCFSVRPRMEDSGLRTSHYCCRPDKARAWVKNDPFWITVCHFTVHCGHGVVIQPDRTMPKVLLN